MASSEFKNILVARTDRLGDVVVSSSCLGPVRIAHPEASLHWMVANPWRCLFHEHPAVSTLLENPEGGLIERSFRLSRRYRQCGVDALALLQPDFAAAWAGVLARVPVRAGFVRPKAGPQLLSDSLPYRKSQGLRHEAQYNFEVLARLGVPMPEKFEPRLSLNPAARKSLADKWGGPGEPGAGRAVFHLAAHGGKPRVDLEVFGALAGWLARERGLSPVLVGVETDPPLDQVAGAFEIEADGIRDLRGRTDAAETGWLMSRASICVARDSGPAHLAAAVGCPTLTIFVDPRPILGPVRWKPLGPKVEVIPAGPGEREPGKVRAAAERLLSM